MEDSNNGKFDFNLESKIGHAKFNDCLDQTAWS